MKKIMWIIAIMLMCSSMLSFAVGVTDDTLPAAVKVSAPGVYPIVEEKVTITFLGPGEDKELFETCWYAQRLEEITNVHINWELVPRDKTAKTEKKRLILASGDLPDVFYSMYVLPDEQLKYGTEGYFLPLNDMVEEHGYYLKKIYEEYPEYEKATIAPDGNQYSLAYMGECYHCTLSQRMWVNRIWLKDLGLSIPTTTDEFYQMLKDFKEKDPNGNGKQDEIPLSGAPQNGWHASPWEFLMNAFIYNKQPSSGEQSAGGGWWIEVKNGKCDFVGNKPEWREGLRYMQKLFKEGLIDPAAFTQDRTALRQLGEYEEVILGAVGASFVGDFTVRGATGSGREELYDPVGPLKGPKGHQSAPYEPAGGIGEPGNFLITKECENPLVAFKWADLRYDEVESLTYYWGPQDEYWRWAKPGEVNVEGKPAKWALVGERWAGEERLQMRPWAWGNWNYVPKLRYGMAMDLSVDIHHRTMLDPMLYRASKLMEAHVPEEYYPYIWIKGDVLEELAPLTTAIREFMIENTSRFIMGDLDIEEDWDGYVSELDKLGLKRYLELHQEEMDRVKGL